MKVRISTIDEEFQKARTKGARDIRKRKRRTGYISSGHHARLIHEGLRHDKGLIRVSTKEFGKQNPRLRAARELESEGLVARNKEWAGNVYNITQRGRDTAAHYGITHKKIPDFMK